MTFELEWRKITHQGIAYIKKDRSLQIGLVVAVVGIVAGGSFYGYRWWREQREEKAQLAFADSFEAYGQALGLQFKKDAKSEDKKELWEQVDIDFKHSLEQNSHSSLAPFFKAFQAQAVAYQGNRDEALLLMREAVKKFSNKNPYRGLYEVSLSLMLLDGDDKDIAEGLKVLDGIGSDKEALAQDMALYYSGLYFNSIGESAKAVEYWQKQVSPEQVSPEQVSPEQVSPEQVSPEVVSLPVVSDKEKSPWRQLAEVKLSDLGHTRSTLEKS